MSAYWELGVIVLHMLCTLLKLVFDSIIFTYSIYLLWKVITGHEVKLHLSHREGTEKVRGAQTGETRR